MLLNSFRQMSDGERLPQHTQSESCDENRFAVQKSSSGFVLFVFPYFPVLGWPAMHLLFKIIKWIRRVNLISVCSTVSVMTSTLQLASCHVLMPWMRCFRFLYYTSYGEARGFEVERVGERGAVWEWVPFPSGEGSGTPEFIWTFWIKIVHFGAFCALVLPHCICNICA